jgi:hypothetical protein
MNNKTDLIKEIRDRVKELNSQPNQKVITIKLSKSLWEKYQTQVKELTGLEPSMTKIEDVPLSLLNEDEHGYYDRRKLEVNYIIEESKTFYS